jgi:hypothetical protein
MDVNFTKKHEGCWPDVDLTKNPKDVVKDLGRAIDKNTPDLPSPKDIGRAVDRNTPDLPNPREVGQALPNLGSGSKPGGLGSNVDNPLPNPNQVGSQASAEYWRVPFGWQGPYCLFMYSEYCGCLLVKESCCELTLGSCNCCKCGF